MDRANREVLKEALGRLIVITWFDPYDVNEELNIKDIGDIKKAYYETSGFFIGVSNDQVLLGNNKDLDNEGVYKGYGVVPCSLITKVDIMDRNCR